MLYYITGWVRDSEIGSSVSAVECGVGGGGGDGGDGGVCVCVCVCVEKIPKYKEESGRRYFLFPWNNRYQMGVIKEGIWITTVK